MGGEVFKRLNEHIVLVCRELPDQRRSGHNEQYEMADFVKSAFGVFFFQHQSMLDYQRKMKEKHGRSNLETVFGVRNVPSDTWIRAQLDEIAPEGLSPIFNAALGTAEEAGLLAG
jgi:hypothetical protein